VYFNQIVKSPMFMKFYMTLNERTKVDVSANHFDIANQQYVPPPKPFNPLLAMKGQYQAIKTHQKEDKEAKIEILSNMKLFLLEKVS